MMTNVIAYLHTTFAYQSAAMQLMVGQANFDAQQLHLKEALPIKVPANTNEWNVAMPPDGITGGIQTSNYLYKFNAGRLLSIQTKSRSFGASARQPSLIDTNGAYQLARTWLTALSVDVPALESNCSYTVQSAASAAPRETSRGVERSRNRPGATNSVAHASANTSNTNNTRLPLFRVVWGGGHERHSAARQSQPQVSVEILGSTKQCVSLKIMNPAILKAPPLQVTNAAALLGPQPPPQFFVESLLGGKAAYDTVARPEHVYVWLLSNQTDEPNSKTNRTPAVAADAATAAAISRALTDFNSYSWLEEKACIPDYGVGLRFTKAAETLDCFWCYECDHLQITYHGLSGEKDCDVARPALMRAVQALFPKDEILKNLGVFKPTVPK